MCSNEFGSHKVEDVICKILEGGDLGKFDAHINMNHPTK